MRDFFSSSSPVFSRRKRHKKKEEREREKDEIREGERRHTRESLGSATGADTSAVLQERERERCRQNKKLNTTVCEVILSQSVYTAWGSV